MNPSFTTHPPNCVYSDWGMLNSISTEVAPVKSNLIKWHLFDRNYDQHDCGARIFFSILLSATDVPLTNHKHPQHTIASKSFLPFVAVQLSQYFTPSNDSATFSKTFNMLMIIFAMNNFENVLQKET